MFGLRPMFMLKCVIDRDGTIMRTLVTGLCNFTHVIEGFGIVDLSAVGSKPRPLITGSLVLLTNPQLLYTPYIIYCDPPPPRYTFATLK